MRKAVLQPTSEDTFRIIYESEAQGATLEAEIQRAARQEEQGDIEGACNTRFHAVQQFTELIPEDIVVELDWEWEPNQSALLLVSLSAIDHFLAGDFEMSAAMLEMMLDLDPEDHLGATTRLALSYVALEEWELLDEIIDDISDKYPEKEIVKMWSEFRRTGSVPAGEIAHFRKAFPEHWAEFTATEHPVDERYKGDMSREKPSRAALARALWIETEHLWSAFPGFSEALRG